ncbi:MAG: hypothetical protein LBD97_05575 [Bifidobacteriaceae bacterium]|nr:hypothetical protein [Bifidobacteriaceae bacterium]
MTPRPWRDGVGVVGGEADGVVAAGSAGSVGSVGSVGAPRRQDRGERTCGGDRTASGAGRYDGGM